jgi:regulator of cell morphogenesis and NO signaling
METLVIDEPKKVRTVGQIAGDDVRKAGVFKKFGIEFCCGGHKSLQAACNELNLDINEVEDALKRATIENKNWAFDFSNWDVDFLIDYIYNQHHLFFYEEAPAICQLLEKVVPHHSKNHPALNKVYSLFFTLKRELLAHFSEEEGTVFPLIRTLFQAKKFNAYISVASLKQVEAVLHSMESDHEDEGVIFGELRQVTNNYNPPASACTSFKLLYHKLKALDEDLHQHIHLENNILFPKAVELKKELLQLNLLQSV